MEGYRGTDINSLIYRNQLCVEMIFLCFWLEKQEVLKAVSSHVKFGLIVALAQWHYLLARP